MTTSDTSALFAPDDFDEIEEQYFEDIRDEGAVYADPSGWQESISDAAMFIPEMLLPASELVNYRLDENDTLHKYKEPILELISVWEGREVHADSVTLCHSVSCATMLTLLVLKMRGVKRIVFETPAYGVTINQAKHLGLDTDLIPTYIDESFRLEKDRVRRSVNKNSALWLTQPRMSLGVDQRPEYVAELARSMPPDTFLVIDEATEQRVPSTLASLNELIPDHVELVRLRGVTKGLGLNGLRLSFVLHDSAMRTSTQEAQAIVGDSLDVFSLAVAAGLGRDSERFVRCLDIARGQVSKLRTRATRLAWGTSLRVSPLVNGYIGSVAVPLSPGDGKGRMDLLEHCQAKRTPVILGSTMRFARSDSWEFVRVNYFSAPHHIARGIDTLVSFLT